jgi:Na+/proline symporter/signal transduction histidine kinase
MNILSNISSHIDASIFIGFLALNLILGLISSKGISTMRSYSIGDKDFSTSTIVFTIVATWVSGEFFFTIVAESYLQGLGFILAVVLCEFLNLFSIGKFFAPRMNEFLNKLSIAEAMGDLYGKNVRILTAFSGFIGISGIIAIQLQISGLLFQYALNIPLAYGIIISGIIITIYSSLGGIKSVTFTDVIQFFAFCTIIPIIAYFLMRGITTEKSVIETITNNPIFSFSNTFSLANPNIYYLMSLFLWCLIPSFNPAFFQRIVMSRDTNQASQSFIIASLLCTFLAIVVAWIGILVLTIYPNIKSDDILQVLILEHDWFIGFKGIILAGIMAMVMSTVDSYINSSSILLVHDLRQTLSKRLLIDELKTTRIYSAAIGVIAIIFAVRSGSFLELFIWASMFYMPVVTVPFIMTVLGFRSSGKSVMTGMIAGFVAAMLWEMLLKETVHNVGGLVPGMLANLLTLFAVHYLTNQPGGWVKRDIINTEIIQTKANGIKLPFWQSINIMLKKNVPKKETNIALFGVFTLISNFLSSNMLPQAVYANYSFVLNAIYIATILFSTILVSYSLWPQKWKKPNFVLIIWHAVIFIVPICLSSLAVIITDFSEMQLMLFLINIAVISILLHWKTILFFVSSGVLLVFLIYKNLIMQGQITLEIFTVEFKLVYLLIMVSGAIIAFFKPKQEYLEATEAKADELEGEVGGLKEEVDNLGHVVGDLNNKVCELNEVANFYSVRVEDQAKEIERLGATAQKILNNVNHELRLPVGNVVNFAEMLSEGLEKYSKEHQKMLLDEVLQNSNRLSSMILNMLDLAMLNAKKIELKKQTINLSEMIYDRVKNCAKIYLQGKHIDFEMNIEPEIFVFVDPNYIRQTIDNLIINANFYSEKGTIEVSLSRNLENNIEIVIKDQGIGILKHELYDIFMPFKMGSKTDTQAQGRGVGLALCKAAVEAHHGTISVESNGYGATFRVMLPLFN